MFLCKTSQKIMIFDAPQVYMKLNLGFAWMVWTYLEQIPNAFFVSCCLLEMSVFTKKLTQTDVALFTGIKKCCIVLFLWVGRAHHVNFCQKTFIVYISKRRQVVTFPSAVSQNGTSLNKYLLFWDNAQSIVRFWQEGNTEICYSRNLRKGK